MPVIAVATRWTAKCRNEEQALSSKAVRQPAEEDCAKHGSCEITTAGNPDIYVGRSAT